MSDALPWLPSFPLSSKLSCNTHPSKLKSSRGVHRSPFDLHPKLYWITLLAPLRIPERII
ncbi:hypothetical protein B0H19DRAFT_376809 [Mycena capillaripes]|nr:hypothetical protein B0H19DRAFT_376809 [Mycena capillaripes]